MRGTGADYLWGSGLGLTAMVGALPWWGQLLVPLACGGAWIALRAWRWHVVRSRRVRILARERMYREAFEFSALAMAEENPQNLAGIAPRLLQALCGVAGWEGGAFWEVYGERLICVAWWQSPSCPSDALEAFSRTHQFTKGEDFAGRVWELNAPLWLSEFVGAEGWKFPRAAAFAEAGMRSAYGFPMRSGNRVVGVLEFFGKALRLPDAPMEALFWATSRQVAQLIERRRVETQMRCQAELLDLSFAAIMVWQDPGGISYWNRAAEKLYGYPREEALGHSPEDLLATRYPEGGREAVQAVLGKSGVWEGLLEHRTKSGMLLTVESRMVFFRGALETAIGAVMESNLDVTEQRRAQAEVLALNLALEQRVAERTAELEAANRELESFSYSVSHDLRAPLRAITGFASILEEETKGRLGPEGVRLLGVIIQNAHRMGQLVNDLLDFARLSRQPLDRRSVDMAHLARECFEELAPERAGRRVDLIVGALPACIADASLMRQALLNLLSNAVKFTRVRDPGRVEVGATVQQGCPVVYWVKDNGMGFDPKYADKLFGVFQRLHPGDDYEGTGVGLAIVERIIHRHGGRIWGEGVVDSGATFFFTLEGNGHGHGRGGDGQPGPLNEGVRP